MRLEQGEEATATAGATKKKHTQQPWQQERAVSMCMYSVGVQMFATDT